MKGWLSLIAATAAIIATAQSNFTIVRPADGSSVRETVRILFPKTAVPKDGYVGIFVGGKFLEAIVPIQGANYSFYDLNTKEKGIADGPLTIEAVLYADFADRPRIIDRSKIDVTVANSASIPVPEGGLDLKYKFKAGTNWTYQVEQRMAVNTMSEAMAGTVSSNSLLAGADVERIRVQYSVDNAYSNGDGLIRIQAVPQKGKHSAIFTVEGNDEPKRYEDYEMAPIYMRVNSRGKELFGVVPQYFPVWGTAGDTIVTDLIAAMPLPQLPAEKVVVGGDPFNTRFQLGDINLEKRSELTSVVAQGLAARGDLVSVEWEMGHPCARIRNTLSARTPGAGAAGGENADSRIVKAQKIEEDIFLALDTGAIVKMVREYTIDAKIEAPVQQAPPAAGAGGNTAGTQGTAGVGTINPGGGTRGGGPGGPGLGVNRTPRIEIRQNGRPPRPGAGGARGGGVGGGRPAPGGGDNPGGSGRTGNSGNTNRIMRITVQLTFILEK